jgi:GT2 family glycosyltransferase
MGNEKMTERSWPKISIIILNWNSWKDTVECLESLGQILYPYYEVIVVDNGSVNESMEKIREYCIGKIKPDSKYFTYNKKNKPIKIIEYTREESSAGGKETEFENIEANKKLILIKNEKNYGFAEGNNIAIRYAMNFLKPEYILLLNNDTIVDKNFLNKMVEIGERDNSNGIVGPKIYFYDYKGTPNVISFTGADLIIWKANEIRYGFKQQDEGQFNNEMEVDKIEGSCMLIKTKLLDEIGLLDSDFFAYWEETDLCYRASRKGYKIIYSPYAIIWHKIGASSGGISNPLRIYYITRNTFLFLKKHATLYETLLFSIFFSFYDLWFKTIIYLFYYKDTKKFIHFIKGVKDGIKICIEYRVNEIGGPPLKSSSTLVSR